jgi:hypothetical protein
MVEVHPSFRQRSTFRNIQYDRWFKTKFLPVSFGDPRTGCNRGIDSRRTSPKEMDNGRPEEESPRAAVLEFQWRIFVSVKDQLGIRPSCYFNSHGQGPPVIGQERIAMALDRIFKSLIVVPLTPVPSLIE